MEHIPQSKAERFENGSVTSWEYEMKNSSLNVAPISIRGRYPETGYTANTVSDSIVYVLEGMGTLGSSDGSAIALSVGDQAHLAVGDEYYFEGNLNIIYAATPIWTPKQTLHTD